MKELIEKLENVRDYHEHWYNGKQCAIIPYDLIEELIQALSQSDGESKIDKAIKTFEDAKSKATSLRDTIYLDGVLAILDSIKNEPPQTK